MKPHEVNLVIYFRPNDKTRRTEYINLRVDRHIADEAMDMFAAYHTLKKEKIFTIKTIDGRFMIKTSLIELMNINRN